jgi:hypothetical protein
MDYGKGVYGGADRGSKFGGNPYMNQSIEMGGTLDKKAPATSLGSYMKLIANKPGS